MSRDDALLCLERHATSKIRRAEDLAAIATMGFRGEALPSIASVSRFTLTTRERDSGEVAGTQIVISGGKIVEVKESGGAPGTTIEVRQIFFNLPARRKFLRTEETEATHIHHYLVLAALAFPGVAFTFQKDGRIVWQLPGVKSGADVPARLAALRERLRALYGNEQKLLAVNFVAEMQSFDAGGGGDMLEDASSRTSEFRLWGFIGAPGVSRSTREDQHLFVNRRPVENRGLNFALLEGYHTALMKGQFPVCCLFLEIDPAAVDVNIHPSKREVKFHREAEVRRMVAHAVRETLLKLHSHEPAPDRPRPLPPAGAGAAEPSGAPNLTATPPLPRIPLPIESTAGPATPAAHQTPLQMGFTRPHSEVPPPQTATPGPQSAAAPHPQSAVQSPQSFSSPVPLLHVPLRLVGVIGRLYVVLESDRGLVLLDQHAAHERILFEQMLNRLEQHEVASSQKLLLPATVELSARDAAFVRDHMTVLIRLGVGLSEFGDRTFLLDALPPFVKASDPRRFVLELVDELKAAGQEVNTLRLGEHVVAKTVCRHAVKANDPLSGPELENLVNDLRQCVMPYTCPHGRPTLIEMNYRELEKKFGRTQ
jgi:DNA mismatch repair protein MutL